MTCTVPKDERSDYVQTLVLEMFEAMEGPDVVVTPDTSLGKHGLGHTMVKRKSYHKAIGDRLAVKGCAMRTLTPNSFADSKLKFVGDVANLVEKDLM